MPLCALGEFSRGFMMATMMSGLFICGQTDHSNTEIQIGPAVPGTECSAASRPSESSARYAQAQWKQRCANGSKRMMIGEKGKHPPTPHPHHPT